MYEELRARHAVFDPERVVSNVCGLLVGTIETMSQAIVQVVDQLLADPARLAQAREAAQAEDSMHFDAIVFEALRFNPITTIQFRFAEAEREIGTGPPYAHSVKAATLIAACTGSAMFDPDLMPSPEDFKTDRPASSYLHLGFGHHVCLGKHLGLVAIPEAVRQAVLKPDLRRKAGAGGHIDFAGGPFRNTSRSNGAGPPARGPMTAAAFALRPLALWLEKGPQVFEGGSHENSAPMKIVPLSSERQATACEGGPMCAH